MVLNTQPGILTHEPWENFRRRIVAISGVLEAMGAIPAVDAQMALILDVQTEEWWTDTNHRELELMRRKLRALVPLIEKKKRSPEPNSELASAT